MALTSLTYIKVIDPCSNKLVKLWAGQGIEFWKDETTASQTYCDLFATSSGSGGITTFEKTVSGAEATLLNSTGIDLTTFVFSDKNPTSSVFIPNRKIRVYINGQRLSITEYTYTGIMFFFNAGTVINGGDRLIIDQF